MTVNPEILMEIVDEALASAAGDVRWTNAIKRGADLILKNCCLPQDDQTLLILSTSGHYYRTTLEECREIPPNDEEGELCPAFRLSRPCKHRAAYKLLLLYNERAATA